MIRFNKSQEKQQVNWKNNKSSYLKGKWLNDKMTIDTYERGECFMGIEIGQKAPNFTLKNQHNEEVSLSDYQGKNVVLYFYPKDMTPGCTTQACDFRDQHAKFEDVNTVIIGISPDPIEKHMKFIGKHELPFMLLADVDHEVAEMYEVWKLKKMFGKEFHGIERSTFIIDREGIVREIERKVKVKDHATKVFSYVTEHLV